MFDKDEIEKKAAELELSPADVERDYVQSWIIKEVASDKYLSPLMRVKGSGALRKFYYPNTRFARDLDYSTPSHIERDFLRERLISVGEAIQKQTGVKFVEENIRVDSKDLPEKMNVDALEARMYFQGVYTDGKYDLKTQVDVTRGENFSLPIQELPIIHPYSDASAFEGQVFRSQKLEEIIATKFITLIHRQKPGDFWDLVYSTFLSNDYELNRGQVIRTLVAKTNFGQSIEQVRQYFLDLPIREKYEKTWAGILVPATHSVSFDEAYDVFLSSIGSFFDEVTTYVRDLFSPGTSSGFSSLFREEIIAAGHKKKLVEVTYADKTRLMEPYRLEFYTRESDGTTNEYLWVYDQTGGNSQTQSIKQFLCDRIQNVQATDIDFAPQWDIEL